MTPRQYTPMLVHFPETGEIITHQMFVTPAMAEQWLTCMPKNRRLSLPWVATIARDIKEGRWKVNGDTIRFSSEGHLIDGQHRLRAVIEAGCMVMVEVKVNLPPDAIHMIDVNRKRTTGDVLVMAGVTNANNASSIAKMALEFISNRTTTLERPSSLEIQQFVFDNPYIVELAGSAHTYRGPMTATSLGTVLFLANQRGLYNDEVEQFLVGVGRGELLERGDPRLTLRNFGVNERQRTRSTIRREAGFIATARAWNAFARRETLLAIRVGDVNKWAEMEIQGYSPDHHTLPF